jgi:hypothetical protein
MSPLIGNQPDMRKQDRLSASFVVLSLTLLAGCAAKVLSFGSAGAAETIPPDGGSAADGALAADASPLGSTDVIAALSDAEASQLCAWLVSTYPGPQPASFQVAGGYTGGGSYGCTGAGASAPLVRVFLDQDLCVLNLRHAPCQATVGELQHCASYFNANYTTLDCSGPAQAACAAFEGAASCDETVFQGTLQPTSPTSACSGELPVASNVTCTPP